MNNLKQSFFKEKKLAYHFLISFFIVTVWVIIAQNQYSYNYNFPELFGLTLFPLIPATFSLFLVYVTYAWIENKFENKNIVKGFLFFTLLSWVILIIGETVGYHWFGVQNLHHAGYSGLPICNCMHAPFWMQLSYFLIAPIYFVTCSMLGLENNIKDKKI